MNHSLAACPKIGVHFKALIALNKFARSGTKATAQKAKLRNNLNKAYEQLNTKFRQELNALVPESHRGKNKGSALTSAKRGQTLAERPKGSRINVADMEQGRAVSRFSGALRFAGRGVAVLDGGMRIHQVHSKYQSGEDWQRELAVQTAGMSGAGVTGFATGRLVKHGLLRIGLAATPGGWLILIGSTIITSALLATQMDEKAQSMAGRAWDWMFKE